MAPPRPPKSIPRVHRPRAPEPSARLVDPASLPSIHIISSSALSSCPPPIPSHPKPTQQAAPTRTPSTVATNKMSNQQSNISSSINSISSINSHRSIPPIPPVTAPLSAALSGLNHNHNVNQQQQQLRNPVSTFSRRQPALQQQTLVTSSSSSSQLPPPRSLTPSTVQQQQSNFISNAFNQVVGRSPSPVNQANANSNSVTLQVPRPENERVTNEYVDTPFTNQKLNAPGSRHSLATATVTSRNNVNSNNNNSHHHYNFHDHQNHLHLTNIATIGQSVANSMLTDGISNNNNNNNNNNSKTILPNRTLLQRPNVLPITKQPSFRNSTNNTLSKKDAGLHQHFSHCPEDSIVQNGMMVGASIDDQLNSITCPQCNRCRCEECLKPRELPSKWILNKIYCSADSCIDYTSCLCCVKSIFYHCNDHEHELDCESKTFRCAEDPCSCVPYKRVSRWGCLSLLSVLLPCLCLYWPMRGCMSLCAKCYAKHRRHGCRCNNSTKSSPSSAINSTNNSFNSRQNIIDLASPTFQDQPPTHLHHSRRNNNDLTPEKRLLDSNSEY